MKNRIKSFALRHVTSLCIGFALVFMLFVTGGMIRSIKQNLDNIRKISVVTGDSRYSLADIPVLAVGENYITHKSCTSVRGISSGEGQIRSQRWDIR